MKIETLAVHAGRHIDPATGAVAAPIYLSTTYERGAEGGFDLQQQGGDGRTDGRIFH